MKILITGIHGFVGSNIVSSLSEQYELYGLDIVAPEKQGVIKTFSWHDLDRDVIPAVDAIIHLAGKAHDTKKQSDAESYFSVNTELTKKIFDYFLKSTASKFFFFSSVKAAADTVEGDILTENVIPAPIGPYGESKIKAETYIQSRFVPAEKRVYILRPCMIHGPGNKGNLNLLYQIVRKGIPWPLGSFDNKRSFTSIGNLTFIIEQMLTQDVQSGIYHIADDDPISTNRLIEIICEAMGRKAHIWRLNKRLVSVSAHIGTKLHLPLNEERLQKLTENYVVSNAKIKNAIGADSLPVRSEEGLRYTLKNFISR